MQMQDHKEKYLRKTIALLRPKVIILVFHLS